MQTFIYVVWQGTRGRGVRHVVYWRHSIDTVQPLKVNLILYENDVLQVRYLLIPTRLLLILQNDLREAK